jgi:hypothetical protein
LARLFKARGAAKAASLAFAGHRLKIVYAGRYGQRLILNAGGGYYVF